MNLNETDESDSETDTLDSLRDATFECESENQTDILSKPLYVNASLTVEEMVYEILDLYVKDALKKKTLYKILTLLDFALPKPNNLPKTKYFLMKMIDSLLPEKNQIIKRYRSCEDCGEYLGEWSVHCNSCINCESRKVNGLFIEYNLHSALKDAFETRNLKKLVHEFGNGMKTENDFICDITDCAKFKFLKKEAITGKYDLCMLWNTDGIPISNSSNSQIWLIQAQIINIPPQHRRNYQFVCGIYYSTVKKPNMTTFLYPFVQRLQNLYRDGINWYDGMNTINSKMIAPIATIDAPARATVQNVMQYNGEYGCSFCEHVGKTYRIGSGHNRVYCPSDSLHATLRTKERMYVQAKVALNNNLKHVCGVKGPSVVTLIPHFDMAESIVPDYMHSILLGVWRMLLDLWFNSKNKDEPYYITKLNRTEIDSQLQQIHPLIISLECRDK